MADHRKNVSESGSKDFELRDFAEEARIPVDQARELMEKHGSDRETLMAEAAKLSDPQEGRQTIEISETMD